MYNDDDKKRAVERFPTFREYYVNKRGEISAQLTPKGPKQGGKVRRWTQEELLEVQAGMAQNLTAEQIAQRINRTPKAVYVRMSLIKSTQEARQQLVMGNAPRRPKTRVTYAKMKSRILGFVKQNQAVSKTALVEGVKGNQQRVREVANKMIKKGELQYTNNLVMLAGAQVSKPSNIVKIKEPAKKELQYSGGAMFEANMGKLLLIGGLIAGGIWLALVAMIVMFIGGWK